MKTRFGIALAVLSAIFTLAGCGSGDSDPSPSPSVQANKGLSVALAIQAGQRAQERSAASTSQEGGGASGQAASGASTAYTSNALAPAYALSNDGLTVTGYGIASAQADSAILELYFSTSSSYPRTGISDSTSPGSSGQTTPATAPITEADLESVIAALTGQGVDRADIEYIGGSYYDPYYASATLRVTVRDVGKLGDLLKAASDAAAGLTDVYLQGSYVSYTVSDCAALEEAAMTAAAQDADARATALASAVGVARGVIKGAYNEAYSPFGGAACTAGYVGPYAIGGVVYAEGQSTDVRVYASITVTYGIQ
ncbi:MAG: SIMPL domain-containing protein [Dehalococcoidia bacterium]|nr:SIMPL domain-containing protein [Dehalococcoidia bacterium]